MPDALETVRAAGEASPAPPPSDDDGETGTYYELGIHEWVPVAATTSQESVPHSAITWPLHPRPPQVHTYNTYHPQAVRLPLDAAGVQVTATGHWVGTIIHGPYYQAQYWAIRVDTDLLPERATQALLDSVLQIGDDLFDRGLDVAVPVLPQRHAGYAMVLVYPKVIEVARPTPDVAVLIDATSIGGHYFAAVFPSETTFEEVYQYIRNQTRADVDRVWIYVGVNPSPCQGGPIVLRSGDVLEVVRNDSQPPQPRVIEALFLPHSPRHRLDHVPQYSRTPGFCLLSAGRRWHLHAYHHNRRNVLEAVAAVLDADADELTLCEAAGFQDLDMMGEPCAYLVSAIHLPPRDGTDQLLEGRRDVFTFLDLRPLGFKPRVHYSHTCCVHIPTLLALLWHSCHSRHRATG